MLQYPVSGSGTVLRKESEPKCCKCGSIGTGSHKEVASNHDRDNQNGGVFNTGRKGHLEDGAGVQ